MTVMFNDFLARILSKVVVRKGKIRTDRSVPR